MPSLPPVEMSAADFEQYMQFIGPENTSNILYTDRVVNRFVVTSIGDFNGARLLNIIPTNAEGDRVGSRHRLLPYLDGDYDALVPTNPELSLIMWHEDYRTDASPEPYFARCGGQTTTGITAMYHYR